MKRPNKISRIKSEQIRSDSGRGRYNEKNLKQENMTCKLQRWKSSAERIIHFKNRLFLKECCMSHEALKVHDVQSDEAEEMPSIEFSKTHGKRKVPNLIPGLSEGDCDMNLQENFCITDGNSPEGDAGTSDISGAECMKDDDGLHDNSEANSNKPSVGFVRCADIIDQQEEPCEETSELMYAHIPISPISLLVQTVDGPESIDEKVERPSPKHGPGEFFSDDLKLLFDCINEALLEIYERYFGPSPWVSLSNQKPDHVQKVMISQEVMEGMDWYNPFQYPGTLEQIVGKDLAKAGTWMDL
ncbi:hypothetical protein QJS10_CPA02g01014 [Acorus calamus]|uniref:DUF4378 domain-containing protein n=1 Tax=Acorus calamus TaxID=4465 RepID=A0AAV9FFM5_ACOCL|nr:hypothetical protein QJS10_CPA02g01014 [Acorus calamus]